MSETNFFWDPLSDNILQERNEAAAVTAEYTTEPGLYGNLISQNRGGVESQYHFDALGSTLALTDETQQVTDTIAYTAFGEQTEQTGSTECPFQYIGKSGYFRLEVIADYQVRRRSLATKWAQWLSKDPSLYSGVINLYRYVSNRPQLAIDPSGLIDFGFTPYPVNGFDWTAIDGFFGLMSVVGVTTFDLTFNCECQRTHRILPRRRCYLDCDLHVSARLYLYRELIECLNNPNDKRCDEIRPSVPKPLPTLDTVYGHEQLHIVSLHARLSEYAAEIATWEGYMPCCSCASNRQRLLEAATDRLCRIMVGETHNPPKHIPENPWPHPSDGVWSPPIGTRPRDPIEKIDFEPPKDLVITVGDRLVNCIDYFEPPPMPPVIELP